MNQKKKTKTVMKVLFAFLGVLVIVLIGAIAYFYLIGDIFQEEEESLITCGCYYLDPQVSSTCSGDAKRAFKFNISQGTIQDCSASCPLTELSTNMLYSTTPQDSYLTCTVRNIPNASCNFMEIKTEEGLIVTGRITPEEIITVDATFDSAEYTNHQFLINNVPAEPDEVDGNRITKTITDLGEASTLQISAQARNHRGDTVSSIICNRLIDISTTARAGVSEFSLDTIIQDGQTRIRSAIVNVGGLEDKDTILEFKFNNNTLIMNQGFDLEPQRGRISISGESLYNEDNFSDDSFEILNRYEGVVDISVEVVQENNSLGIATTTIDLLTQEDIDPERPDEDDPDSDDDEDDDRDSEDDDRDSDDEQPEEPDDTEYSNFTVTKESSAICVERIEPDNTTTFTITVRNNASFNDTIESIKDKLPLGFTYVENSSKLNGNDISDASYVTVTTVGESKEIVWEPEDSWLISAGGNLTITFDAIAGDQALTGNNLNEVIVTPSEIPEDPSTLRASVELVVAQDCDDVAEIIPQTNIFDTIIGRIFVGIIIVIFGYSIYSSHKGDSLAKAVLNSTIYKEAEMTSYKIFKPKKYFEEKILQRRERKR